MPDILPFETGFFIGVFSAPMKNTPLSKPEKTDRAKLLKLGHQILEQIGKDALDLGKVLVEFHDRRLYRETHKTFEDFAWQEFQVCRSVAYELMKWAKAPSAIADRIKNIAQARAVFRLGTELEQGQALAIATADGPATAAKIRTAVEVLSECQSAEERKELVERFEEEAKKPAAAGRVEPKRRDEGPALIRTCVAKLNLARPWLKKLDDRGEPALKMLDSLVAFVEGSSEVSDEDSRRAA